MKFNSIIKFIPALGLLVLFGCASAPTVLPVSATPLPIVESTTTVVVPKSLLTACPPIKDLPVQQYTQDDLLSIIKKWQNQYSECRRNHHQLSLLVIKAFNISPTASSTKKSVTVNTVPNTKTVQK